VEGSTKIVAYEQVIIFSAWCALTEMLVYWLWKFRGKYASLDEPFVKSISSGLWGRW